MMLWLETVGLQYQYIVYAEGLGYNFQIEIPGFIKKFTPIIQFEQIIEVYAMCLLYES